MDPSLWCSILPNAQKIRNSIISKSITTCCCGKLPFLCPHFYIQSCKSGCTGRLFTHGGYFFSNPLSMCWSGRMYFPFDPGWWMGCRPVSREIFVLTLSSSASTVPTFTWFPRQWLPFCTLTINPFETLGLVWQLTSSKCGSILRVFL